MSLKPHNSYQVPQDTAEVARAIFPDGNLYLRMYDAFGTLFEDEDFATLFPQDGQPAEAPFRSRLLKGEIEKMLFEKVLACFRNKDLLKGYRQQRTDSTNVLGAIRAINRLELVGETMRRALNSLSTTVPEWMLANSHPEWIDRYGDRFEDSKLPRSETKREALAEEIGADGLTLFNSLFDNSAPGWLREIPAIKLLWRVWIQNYTWRDDERLRWRTNDELPPSSKFISSPYDEDAHYSKKRSTSWVGYKVHLTETCTEDAPHIITHVETTPATTPDSDMTLDIQLDLKAKDILPHTHLVGLGYIDAGILVASQDEFGLDLVGPAKGDYKWQARAGEGFAAENFQIDWLKQQAICPAKKESISWTTAFDRFKLEVVKVKFSQKDCVPCLFRPQCTHAKKNPRRTITLPTFRT